MIRQVALIVSIALALSGCSYSYDVTAMSSDGHVVFAVDPKSRQQPDCIRQIAVYAEDERQPAWRESVSYDDDCANTFPIVYGISLMGHHQDDTISELEARILRNDVVYEVSTTTGATGYGSGRFVKHADGSIENLPFPIVEPTTSDGSLKP